MKILRGYVVIKLIRSPKVPRAFTSSELSSDMLSDVYSDEIVIRRQVILNTVKSSGFAMNQLMVLACPYQRHWQLFS